MREPRHAWASTPTDEEKARQYKQDYAQRFAKGKVVKKGK